MRRVIAAGFFIGALMWCDAAAADPIACGTSIRPAGMKLPSVRGWHESNRRLVPDVPGVLVSIYADVSESPAGQTASQVADGSLKRWESYAANYLCGDPPPPVQRERLAEVKGAGGRVFSVIALANSERAWRRVTAFLVEDGKLWSFTMEGAPSDVEKNYSVFTGLLQRYRGPMR